MRDRFTVYLAGPIRGLSFDEANDWRDQATTKLRSYGVYARNPLRGKDFLKKEGKLTDAYLDHPLSTSKGITTRDRWDCTTSDVVLVNFIGAKTVSIGTVMECAWADSARTPLVICMEPGNVHEHAMIKEVAGYIVPTLQEGLDITLSILHLGD